MRAGFHLIFIIASGKWQKIIASKTVRTPSTPSTTRIHKTPSTSNAQYSLLA